MPICRKSAIKPSKIIKLANSTEYAHTNLP